MWDIWYFPGTAESTFAAKCFVCNVSHAEAETIVRNLMEQFNVFHAWSERRQ